MKTGPSRAEAARQGAADIPSGDRRGPGGPAHSVGADGSMRADSRSAPHDDTAARSTGARGNTTRRSRKAPSTARTSADTGRRRPAAACPNTPPSGWTRRPQRWDAYRLVRSHRGTVRRTQPRSGSHPPGASHSQGVTIPISPLAWRRGFAADDDVGISTRATRQNAAGLDRRSQPRGPIAFPSRRPSKSRPFPAAPVPEWRDTSR